MNLEQAIVSEGRAIFSAMKSEKESIFNKDYWLGRVMEFVLKDPSFKVDLFRFVDVLPVLLTNDQIAKHVQEYLVKKDRELPALMNTALKAANWSFAKGMAATAIKKNVTEMAERFIAGVDVNDAAPALARLLKQGFTFTIDLLGEKTLSDKEADSYLDRYHRLITALPDTIIRCGGKNSDVDPPNISLKISALSCRLKEEDPTSSVNDLKKRVLPILQLAKKHNVFVNFDVESYESHEIIYQLFDDIARTEDFRAWPHLGIVVQAYLRDSSEHVNDLIKLAKERKTSIAIRLVKGAYWDYEVVKAKLFGHATPVFLEKSQTDHNYEILSQKLLDHVSILRPAFGSHNIRSLSHAIAYANSKNIEKSRYEIQMLYGMAEAERRVLLDRGHHVRIYTPLGEVLPGMSYLVRRLLENTSQMGFLKLTHHDQKNEDALLMAPNTIAAATTTAISTSFKNASHADFTDKNLREQFKSAIDKTKTAFPFSIPIVIAGKKHTSTKSLTRLCPSDLSLTISHCQLANIDHAQQAVSASMNASAALNALPLFERRTHLLRLADILDEDRIMLSALMSYEVGKTWGEADADVAEAIDFCRYYAECADLELANKKMGELDGEHNVLSYQGRGPTVVIAPWNFPLAIICGMSVGAYVAGNPIILKPSEQSTIIAYMLYERMIKAGFLNDAVHFLPGAGEEIGPSLVAHKDVANICFTGSMKVGHDIVKAANTVVTGQRQMKRVVVEMGGKNAIVVDDDADLDEAVLGIILSAFIYAGQKCSAASRIIVIGAMKDQLIERLIAATQSIKVGPAMDPSTFMGPVVDQEAYDRLNGVVYRLKSDPAVKVCHVGEKIHNGYFIPATIVTVNDFNHWVMQEEIFGPVVAIYQAEDLETAINVANSTRYALTGAFYSRSPANIAYAREHFSVGNLYINQKCTGAIVARQPFGGFKMSGTGIKAGGPNYLLNFVDAKLISENTMRRGFTPEVSV